MPAKVEKGEFSNYTFWVFVTGFFGGLYGIAVLSTRTFIPPEIIFLIILAGGTITLGIHFLFLRWLDRYLIEMLVYNYIGWGFILCSLFLAINYFFPKPEGKVESYEVTEIGEMMNMFVYPVMPESPYGRYNYIFMQELFEVDYLPQATEVQIHFQEGYFGYFILDKMIFLKGDMILNPEMQE
ncbi:MAG: hypothetical protein WD077_15445 [Bacteroidia bacterium]